jgi:hypothetical protein
VLIRDIDIRSPALERYYCTIMVQAASFLPQKGHPVASSAHDQQWGSGYDCQASNPYPTVAYSDHVHPAARSDTTKIPPLQTRFPNNNNNKVGSASSFAG